MLQIPECFYISKKLQKKIEQNKFRSYTSDNGRMFPKEHLKGYYGKMRSAAWKTCGKPVVQVEER